MYYNYYRDIEPSDEFYENDQLDNNEELTEYNEFNVLPEYEDISADDSFRSNENFEIEDNFVEFNPSYNCPFYRQLFPGGNFTPPRPPYGPPSGGPGGHQGGAPFEGHGGNPQGMPSMPPPNYKPPKPQVHHAMHGGAYAVEPGSLRPCRYRFAYIWLMNGNSFWAYLTNIGRTSASGFRWNGRRWVYFGVDLRKIESFTCH
jgi:hypothetical protein